MPSLIDNARDEFLILALLYPEFEKALLAANTEFFADTSDLVATDASTQATVLSADIPSTLVAALDADFVSARAATDSAPDDSATLGAAEFDAYVRPPRASQPERASGSGDIDAAAPKAPAHSSAPTVAPAARSRGAAEGEAPPLHVASLGRPVANASDASAEGIQPIALASHAPPSATGYLIWGQDTIPFNASPAQVRQALGATNLGFDGTGVKVGVISNSFNNKGGASSDEASGLLPSASKIHVLQDLPFSPGSPSDDEGRAMMQVVHDVAPGASLYYCTFAGTAADFANNTAGSDRAFADAILALAANGCKVICDDIGFTGIPWFQDGVISQAIKTVEQMGVTYLIAAGNERSGAGSGSTAVSDPGYQSKWKSTGVDLFFNGNASYTHFNDALDFGGGNAFQTITLAPGAHTEFELQWDQAWGAATSDLAFVLTIGNGVVLNNGPGHYGFFTRSESITPHGQSTVLTNDPYVQESADPDFPMLVNQTSAPVQLQVSIVNLSGPDPGFIKYISNGNGNLPNAVTISGENAGTSVGHQESPYAITVGAADAGNTPAFGNDPALSEYFSSGGAGDQWFFDSNGNRLATAQLLNVVDITGVDDISTSESSLGDFFGTSCATPSIAGIVALMLQANANINPDDIRNLLQDSAIPMANPTVSGAGLAQANLAVAFASKLEIDGNGMANVLLGTHLGDTISGEAGADILIGGGGTNILDGGAGADKLDGTGGVGVASYGDAATSVKVFLLNPSLNTGDAAGDTYINIHEVIGSNFGDTLVGDNAGDLLEGGAGGGADAITGKAGDDTIYGGAGKDSLTGGGGVNYLDGGAGADKLNGAGGTSFAYYGDAKAAVKVSLLNPALNTGDAAGDSFVGINNLFGSKFADTLVGNNAGNSENGGAGADTMTGGTGADSLYGAGGADVMNGGGGADQFVYGAANEGGDQIIGFSHAQGDSIWISHTGFGHGLAASGVLAAAKFGTGATATTPTGVGEFLWHASTSTLAWDADGSGAGVAVKIATLTSVTTLTAADIHLY